MRRTFKLLATVAILLASAIPAFADQTVQATLQQRVGHDSRWYVTGCQPGESLTLFYKMAPINGAISVPQTIRVHGMVSYSIAKDVGDTNGDDLSALADRITLVALDGCYGRFRIH